MSVTVREETITQGGVTRTIRFFEITHRDPSHPETWHTHKIRFDPENIFTDVDPGGSGRTAQFEWIGNPLEREIPEHEHEISGFELSTHSYRASRLGAPTVQMYIHNHETGGIAGDSPIPFVPANRPTSRQLEQEANRVAPTAEGSFDPETDSEESDEEIVTDTVDFDFSDEPWFESDIPSTSSNLESFMVSRPANSVDTGNMEIDWQNRTKYEPFYSTNRLEYSTTVELCEGFVPGSQETDEECREIIEQAVAKGILDLSEFYNKAIPFSEEEQRALIDKAQLEYYVDERPNSRVKLLVKVPAADFDNFEDDLSFEQKVSRTFSHSVILKSSSIKEDVGVVSAHFERLNKEAKTKNIAFAKLNLIGESRRLKKFFSKLNRLFINNGIVFRDSHDDSIEIGFDKDFSIEYVLYNSKSMDVGFEAFRKTDPMNSPRTVGYVSNLKEMVREIQSKTGPAGLTEFLLKHTYPRPEISPAGDNMMVPSRDVRLRQSQVVQQTIEANEPSNSDEIYFTSFEKTEQDLAFRDSDFVRQVSLEAESDVRFVGDNLLSILPEIIDRVDSVEEMFTEVLNKIDLGTLASFAATSALGEVPTLRSTISGAVGVFLERLENTNKRAVSSMKQEIQLLLEEVAAFDNVFGLMENVSDLYGQYGHNPPGLPGAQINRLRFASVFGEYMATETSPTGRRLHGHGPHKLDIFIEDFQVKSADYSGTLQSVSSDLINISSRLSAFDRNIQNFLNERQDILDGIVGELLPSGLGPLIGALTREFSRVVDFYSSQVEEVISDVSRAVERNISRIAALPDRVAEYISDLTRTISGIQDEITRRISILGSMAEGLMQSITDFPSNFMNMVSTQIDRIISIIDSKILEIMALKDSILSEVSSMLDNITNSIGNIDQFLEQFEIPSVDELFQTPEIPDIMTLPSLPDNIPTFDIMSYLVTRAENTILSLIQSSIVDVAKNTIKSALEGISTGMSNNLMPSSLDYGGMDINSTLGDGLGLGNIGQNQAAFTSLLGQMTAMAVEMPDGMEPNVAGARLSTMLGEVSETLTPSEVTSLLGGSPSFDATRSVMSVLNSGRYDDLLPFFANGPLAESKISDFFRFLGEQIGPRSIDTAFRRVQDSSGLSSMPISETRRDLLSNRYGDSLSAEQVDGLVKRNLLKGEKKAYKLLEKFFGSSMDTELPAVLGGPNAIFPKNPPSVEYMIDRTLETMFESVVMFFNYSIHGPRGFVQSLSFRQGSRQIYDEIRRSDQDAKTLRNLQIAAAALIPGLPPPPPYFVGDPRIEISDETHYFELMDSPLTSVKAGLQDFSVESSDNTFSFPHPFGQFVWVFRPKEDESSELDIYEHIVEIPAPNRKPYAGNTVLEITALQTLDPTVYDEPVPKIFERSIGLLGDAEIESLFSSSGVQILESQFGRGPLLPMMKYIKKIGYSNVLEFVLEKHVEEILKSTIFNAAVGPYIDDLDSDEINPNAISNWRLEPPSDRIGETQTTLLYLENLRKKTKERFTESSMKEDESLSDSMQKSIMISSVEAIIRTQVVEFIMMVLPVLDRFNKNDVIGDEAVKYIKIKLRESCLKQDPYTPGYFENILREVQKLYEEEWNSKGGLFDSSSGTRLPAPEDATPDVALEYIIKETILKMSSGLRQSLPISSQDPGTVYEIFLKKMLTTYDVVEPISSGIFKYKNKGYGEGLILEKYIQFERAVGTDIDEKETVVMSIEEWKQNLALSGFPLGFEAMTVQIGLRLVYVTKLDSEFRSDYDTRLLGSREDSANITDRLRTFRLFLETEEEGERGEYIYPLPLVSVTKGVSLEDIVDPDFSFTRRDKNLLIGQMIETSTFKFLFEQCFPLQKILSIMTIYTEVMFSSVASARLADVLNQTKETLRSVFDGARNMNDYSYRDRNTQAVGSNAGLISGRPRRVFPEGRSIKGFESVGYRETSSGRSGLRRVITDAVPEVENGD